MWLVVRLVMCVLVGFSLSATPTAVAAAARMVARRSSVSSVIRSMTHSFKADLVIAFDGALGPRDPFLSFQTPLTQEQREFEVFLAERRVEYGLPPEAVKR